VEEVDMGRTAKPKIYILECHVCHVTKEIVVKHLTCKDVANEAPKYGWNGSDGICPVCIKNKAENRAWKCSKDHAFIVNGDYVGLSCPDCGGLLNVATNKYSGLKTIYVDEKTGLTTVK
jgi:hypothetical protein